MRINRSIAVVLGALTVLPILYLAIFLGYLMPRLTSLGQPGGIGEGQYFDLFNVVYRLQAVAAVLCIALVGLYVVFVYRSDTVPAGRRRLWLALLLFGNVVTMPIFWYLHIWRSIPHLKAS